MTPQTITHKRGDTFDRTVFIPPKLPDGYFAGWQVDAQMRTPSGQLVATLACAWLDGADTRVLQITCADTRTWPLAALAFDVQFTRVHDGYVLSSATVLCHVQRDQTILEATP